MLLCWQSRTAWRSWTACRCAQTWKIRFNRCALVLAQIGSTRNDLKNAGITAVPKRKTPGGFPPRAFVQRSMVNRSRIEVLVNAEADRPVVLVAGKLDRAGASRDRVAR